ncbi:MAG: PqqD family protein [Candidatus Omnitrophica bacterium]|jgi:hypothetical protein|nr:PqqD family protein [Candidatus Omnitrophota bacterium]
MKISVSFDKSYKPSEDVVARQVQGEFIIIPITSGVGDEEDAIFTLNETGKAVWDKLDGKKTLKSIINELVKEFDAPLEEIEKDILGITSELLKKKMLVEA